MILRSRIKNASRNARSISASLPRTAAGIWNTPMGSHGLSWPYRADLLGRVIANRKDKVELGRAGQGEFIPGLAARPWSG